MKSQAITHFYSFVHLDITSSSRTVPFKDTGGGGGGVTVIFTFLYDPLTVVEKYDKA
jgi:hypothetical protein